MIARCDQVIAEFTQDHRNNVDEFVTEALELSFYRQLIEGYTKYRRWYSCFYSDKPIEPMNRDTQDTTTRRVVAHIHHGRQLEGNIFALRM